MTKRYKPGKNPNSHKVSEETKEKMRIRMKGNKYGKGQRIGYKHTEETKRKIGLKSIGRIKSIEGRKRISKANSGDRNWRWKGGVSGEDYLARRRFQSSMQKLVFERDDYTCQLCGIRGVDLQVDHIQSWAEYVELRFSIDNCRTLCAKCHYKITFGRPMPENIKGWGHNLLKGRVIT